MTLTRRRFLEAAAACSLGLANLRCVQPFSTTPGPPPGGYGPLLDDPEGLLALPAGFRYTVLSRAGEEMDDGLLVPALHDGMAAFDGPDGLTVLVRNHEVSSGAAASAGPYGPAGERFAGVDASRLYDAGDGEGPALGGTTTLLFDTRTQTLVGHRLSLSGTLRNCAGGPTPWGSWLTCEETTVRAGAGRARDHGYVFEVPADFDAGLVPAVPIVGMGRFNHEAVAVDPDSGVVYLTEDDGEGLLYRYVPVEPGRLLAGGRLQALALADTPGADTRNWDAQRIAVGEERATRWIDLDDVEDPGGDLRHRGHAAGAARFARGEGMWWGDREVWFACTNGGSARKGQIWRYRPGAGEGSAGEEPGTLELFVQPDDGAVVENADNLTVAPWGHLYVCEDGPSYDRMLGVTPEGDVYTLARNARSPGELAGPCFSPDGTTLFVNLQAQGLTVAITGPW